MLIWDYGGARLCMQGRNHHPGQEEWTQGELKHYFVGETNCSMNQRYWEISESVSGLQSVSGAGGGR